MSFKDDLRNTIKDWGEDSQKKVFGDSTAGDFSMIGVKVDGVWIYDPKLTSLNWWIYLIVFVGSWFTIIGAVFWLWVFGKNILKRKARPFRVGEYKRQGFEWLMNNTVRVDGEKYTRVFGDSWKVEKNQRYIVMFKALIAFFISINSLNLNFDQVKWMFGGDPEVVVSPLDQVEEMNFDEIERRVDHYNDSIRGGIKVFPKLLKCDFKYGTQVLNDTTVNYKVIDKITLGDTLIADTLIERWYLVNTENGKGYVLAEYFQVLSVD